MSIRIKMYVIWLQTFGKHSTNRSELIQAKLNRIISYFKLWFFKRDFFVVVLPCQSDFSGKRHNLLIDNQFFFPDLSFTDFKIIFRTQYMVGMKKYLWKTGGQEEQNALKQTRRSWRLKRAFWQLKPSFQSALAFLIAQRKSLMSSLFCRENTELSSWNEHRKADTILKILFGVLNLFFKILFVHLLVYIYMCVCVCVHIHIYIFILLSIHLQIFFLKNSSIFNWRIIALQYCVDLYCISTCISQMYTYAPSLLNLPPISHHIPFL